MKRYVIRLFLLFALLFMTLSLCACLDLSTLLSGQDTRFYLDGELYETVTPDENGQLLTPSVTAPAGYRFDGWYAAADSTEPFDGTTREAYGYFVRCVYTITYSLDGGSTQNPRTYTVDTDTFTLTPPIKEGYTFLGWTGDRLSGLATEVTVPRGTTGDLSFVANYEPTQFRITYDLAGGEGDNPTSYTVLTEDFTLTPPTREGYVFYAWEKDGALYPTYTVTRGSVGDLSLRAVWRTGLSMFSYAPSVSGIPLTSDTPAGEVESGARVTVCAPAVHGDQMFVGWMKGSSLVSYAASYTFTVGSEDVHLVATYEDADPFVYDKASGTPLTLSTGRAVTPSAVYGGGAAILSDATYGAGEATLSAEYLAALSCGTYTYFVDDARGGAWFLICVTDSRRPTDLAIVYDTVHYPDAVLSFACSCAGEHTYSLDGGAPIPCRSGDVLPDYRKEATHTLTVRCDSGGQATLTREGYASSAAPYYESTFTFCGEVYDYAIESEAEYSVLFDYLIAVRGVTDYERDPTAKLTYGFYLCEELLSQLSDEELYGALYARVFSSKSYPMSPTVSTSFSATDPSRCSLTIGYPDGLNAIKSSQVIYPLEDGGNVETAAGRDSLDAALPIDAYPAVPIRTLYELELMPCGVRPTFTDPASAAALVYAQARRVLCRIVDDRMNDYQKVAAIYRYLAVSVTYDDVAFTAADASKYRAFTSYGALIDGLAVCDGYASAFRLLCQIEGIVCEEYTGRNDPADPASGHAWNKYTIDGATYACDVTWARVDDTYVTMKYLMMDEATLLDTGHYENASRPDRFTERVADGTFTYFERIETRAGYDLDVETSQEFFAAVHYGESCEVSYLELRMPVHLASPYLDLMRSPTVKGVVTVGEDTVFVLYR